jgi:hypothetical protein
LGGSSRWDAKAFEICKVFGPTTVHELWLESIYGRFGVRRVVDSFVEIGELKLV